MQLYMTRRWVVEIVQFLFNKHSGFCVHVLMYNSWSFQISHLERVCDNKIACCLIISPMLGVGVRGLLQKSALAKKGHLEVVVEVCSCLGWGNRRKGRKGLSIALSGLLNKSFWKTIGTVISLSTKSEPISAYTLLGNFFKMNNQTIHLFIVSSMGEGKVWKPFFRIREEEMKWEKQPIGLFSLILLPTNPVNTLLPSSLPPRQTSLTAREKKDEIWYSCSVQ